MTGRGIGVDHGPSQNGPYSRVRDLLATFTLNFFSYCDNEISSCINKAKSHVLKLECGSSSSLQSSPTFGLCFCSCITTMGLTFHFADTFTEIW